MPEELVGWGSKTAGLGGVARIGENLRAPEGLGFEDPFPYAGDLAAGVVGLENGGPNQDPRFPIFQVCPWLVRELNQPAPFLEIGRSTGFDGLRAGTHQTWSHPWLR